MTNGSRELVTFKKNIYMQCALLIFTVSLQMRSQHDELSSNLVCLQLITVGKTHEGKNWLCLQLPRMVQLLLICIWVFLKGMNAYYSLMNVLLKQACSSKIGFGEKKIALCHNNGWSFLETNLPYSFKEKNLWL